MSSPCGDSQRRLDARRQLKFLVSAVVPGVTTARLGLMFFGVA